MSTLRGVRRTPETPPLVAVLICEGDGTGLVVQPRLVPIFQAPVPSPLEGSMTGLNPVTRTKPPPLRKKVRGGRAVGKAVITTEALCSWISDILLALTFRFIIFNLSVHPG